MDKKKLVWTLITVAVSGLAAYSIFVHGPEHSKFGCPFCSIRNSSGVVGFVTGICVISTVYTWRQS